MKKYLIVLACLFSSTCLADAPMKACTTEMLQAFTDKAGNAVRSATVYPDKVNPKYQSSGIIQVEADEAGKVEKVLITRSTGLQLLDEAMIDAVKSSEWPALECLPETALTIGIRIKFTPPTQPK